MEDVLLSKEDFEKANCQDVILSCDKKECSQYRTKFSNQAKEAELRGDLINKKIFQILEFITIPVFDERRGNAIYFM